MNQAEEINIVLKNEVPAIYSFLSDIGKRMYFPKFGIMKQSSDARGCLTNASIGVALNDNKDVFCFDSLASNVLINSNDALLYESSFGNFKLRGYWKKELLSKNPSLGGRFITNPIITNGLTHGLSIVSKMFCDENTTVVLPELFWGNYNLIFNVNRGCSFQTYPLYKGIFFNHSFLSEYLSGKKNSVLLFNFPNNPTGFSLTKCDQDKVFLILMHHAQRGNKVLVICDDAYFGFHYSENIAKESLFSRLAMAHENIVAVKIDGPTKEMCSWGLRVGCITIGNKLMNTEISRVLEEKLAGFVRSSVSNVSKLSQSLLVKSLESSSCFDEGEELFNLLKGRYLVVKEELKKNENYSLYFEALPFNSGYFLCVKLVDSLDCEEVRLKLLEEYSIGLISIKKNNLLRIAYSCVKDEKIEIIFESLFKVCEKLVS